MMLTSEARPICFVVGTGRCGSTLLSNILQQSREALVLSEFFVALGPEQSLEGHQADGARVAGLMKALRPDAEQLLHLADVPEVVRLSASAGMQRPVASMLLATFPRLTEDPNALLEEMTEIVSRRPSGAMADHWRALFDALCERLHRRLIIERSGGSLAFVGRLIDLFPEAHFVHLWRDGMECAYSMSRHPYFRVLVARLARRDPTLPVAVCLDSDTPLHRFGAFWSATVMQGLAHLNRCDADRVIHIGFDALTKEPVSTLERIAAFVGLEPGGWIPRAAEQVRSVEARVTEIETDAAYTLERACRPGTAALSRLILR